MSEDQNTEPEPTCQKCGKPLSQCKCMEITVKHEGLSKPKSTEELQQKLDEREAQLAAIALKDFEGEKQKLLERISDPEIRKKVDDMIGDDPDMLKNTQLMASLIGTAITQHGGKTELDEDDGTEPLPAPSTRTRGSAPLDSQTQGVKDRINELYDILESPTISQKEKDMANAEINAYWKEFRRGAKGQQKYEIPPTMACPQCHIVIVTRKGSIPKCANCGWEGNKYQEW